MKPIDFWKMFVGDDTVGAFMCGGSTPDPSRRVEQYVSELGTVYGIVRQNSWQDTFSASQQYPRAVVTANLQAYLQETREEWEAPLREHLATNQVVQEQEQASMDSADTPPAADTAEDVENTEDSLGADDAMEEAPSSLEHLVPEEENIEAANAEADVETDAT